MANYVIDGFVKSLAETISDMALTFIAGRGIYIAGGLIRSIFRIMDKEKFIEYFQYYKNLDNCGGVYEVGGGGRERDTRVVGGDGENERDGTGERRGDREETERRERG